MSENRFIVDAYKAQHVTQRVLDDTPVVLRIAHSDSSSTVTSVVITPATNIVLTDSDGATTLAFATYTTVGALADAINATTNWKCKILDALRSDSTGSSMFVSTTITSSVVNGETVWDALPDTSVLKALTLRCTYNPNVNLDRANTLHRVKLQGIDYYANVNAASANGVRVYEWDAVNKTETLIWGKTSVDATETAITFASGNGLITANYGNDLIVRVQDATSLTDNAANFLQASFIKE